MRSCNPLHDRICRTATIFDGPLTWTTRLGVVHDGAGERLARRRVLDSLEIRTFESQITVILLGEHDTTIRVVPSVILVATQHGEGQTVDVDELVQKVMPSAMDASTSSSTNACRRS